MKWWLLTLLFLFVSATSVVKAYNFDIVSSDPTSISSKETEVNVTLNISSLPSESYFRVSFQKPNNDYFGQLKNDRGEWVKIKTLSTTECADYYKVSDTSATSIVITIKVGDDQNIDAGTYMIKAHRYTSTCKTYSDST